MYEKGRLVRGGREMHPVAGLARSFSEAMEVNQHPDCRDCRQNEQYPLIAGVVGVSPIGNDAHGPQCCQKTSENPFDGFGQDSDGAGQCQADENDN